MIKQKTFSLCALFLFSWSMHAQVALTFQRTGTNASSVKVQVHNAKGQPIEGATASIVSSSHAFKPTAAAVTEAIVCPNVNGNTNPNIELVLKVRGLKESAAFNALELDIHALNGSSKYQESGDGVKRLYNLTASVSGDATTWTKWVTDHDFDIAQGVSTGGKTHRVWGWMTPEKVKPTQDLYLKLQVTKGTENKGCFFGISSVTLKDSVYTPAAPVVSTPLAKRLGIYYHPCGRKTTAYLSACNVTGPAVTNELHYAATTDRLNGYHHIERRDSAEVIRGERFVLDYTAQGINKDYTVTAYFDWNADGVFEAKQEFLNDAAGQAEIMVPAEAREGRVRMRLRLNDNGLEGADDEVHGMIYDFFVYVRSQSPNPPTAIEAVPQTNKGNQQAYNLEGKTIELDNHQGIYIQGGEKRIK